MSLAIGSILSAGTADASPDAITRAFSSAGVDPAQRVLSPPSPTRMVPTSVSTPVKPPTSIAPSVSALLQPISNPISISSIDFEGTDRGTGKLVLRFNSDAAVPDLRTEGSDVVIDVGNAILPASLQRALNVSDFTTPVQRINALHQSSGTQVILSMKGDYESIAYQTGRDYIVEILPQTQSHPAVTVASIARPKFANASSVLPASKNPSNPNAAEYLAHTPQSIVADSTAATIPASALLTMADLDRPPSGVVSDLNAADALKAAEQSVYLDVFFGDRSTGLIAHLLLRSARLYATPDELRQIGLNVPSNIAADETGFLALDALPGLEYQYLEAEQKLVLAVPTALRPKQILGYQTPDAVQATRGHGLVMNYDAYGTSAGGSQTLSVAHAIRWFGRAGTLEQTGVSRAFSDNDLYQRLDTRWSYSDPLRLWSWTGGDLISGSVAWSRAVRMGGLQWRRNFSVRPELITFPIRRFSGSATVPSSVELLVNNVQQFGTEVDDGPFVLDTFPRISGAGDATLIVRDTLGRTTQTTVPIYVDYQRLAPGLSDFSVEAGVLRRGFGGGHDDYDNNLVASGSYRRGITDTITVESHAESDSELKLLGAGGIWSPAGRWGLVSASFAQSKSDADIGELSGNQRTLGYQFNASRFGFDLQSQRVSAGFRDLGSLQTDANTFNGVREQDRASFYASLPNGSAGLTWLQILQDDGTRDRIRTLSWSHVLNGNISLTASVFDSETSGSGAGLNVSVPLGPNRDASLAINRNNGQNEVVAAVRQNVDYEGGWGWELQAGNRQSSFGQAMANVRGQSGEAAFGVQHFSGQRNVFAQASGGLAWMGGQAFLGRRINDAFAVISSNGVAGLPVLYENREIGRTNAKGYLLLTDLRGWQENRIGIDPDLLGPNYRVRDLEHVVTPVDNGALLVKFDLRTVYPAMVVLLDPKGAPVLAGSTGTTNLHGNFIVGFDGEAYLEDLAGITLLTVSSADYVCRYEIPQATHSSNNQMSRLGPLLCEGAKH